MKPTHIHPHLSKRILFVFSFIVFCTVNAFAQPSNDNCAGATTLTSGTSCSNIQYDLKSATASAGIPVGCAAGGTHYDVWFKFTAASSSQTVTISGLQNNFNNPEIQLFSGTCGALVSVTCGTTSFTATGLTTGNTYYIRVSNIGASIAAQGKFNICVTHPPAAPGNDGCGNATTLTSNYTCSNTTGNLYYATSNGPAGACGGATASSTYDVWFRFQAVATAQTVTVGNLGLKLSAPSTYMEVLSGACGSLTSLGCQTVSTTSGRITLTGLTVGAFYYVRVYVLLNPTAVPSTDWNFNICVEHPPANDECAGAVTLTPGATCTNTAGTLDLATVNATTLAGCFPAGSYYDVWYKFTATAVAHTISLSSLGANFTAPRMQAYSGTCAGLTSMAACSGASVLPLAGLTIGNTYYIRVANYNANPSGVGTAADFNICITAAAAPPANDLCSGAVILISSASCAPISGTLVNATASAPAVPGGCGNALAPDIWYSFVAQSNYPQINLGAIGAGLQTDGRIQLLTGSCGSFITVGSCHSIPAAAVTTTLNTATNPGGAGLTIGQTYYIRITHNLLTAPVTSGAYTFNICVTDPIGASMDYAKSYINITDGTVGGTIDPGDVLEIRATLVIARGGVPLLAVRAVDSLAFYDTLKAGGGLSFVSNSLALRTNEGKISNSSGTTFTNSDTDTDAGWYSTAGAGSDTTIQINMGPTATRYSRGKLRSNSRPSNFGNTCIILATYRVKVNAGYGTKINFGGGAFRYRDTLTGVFSTINFPYDSLMVFQSPGSCQNSISQTNILGDEVNGTFGAATGGSPSQNRGTSSNTNYMYQPFNPSGPNDYYYGVADNTSANGSNNQTVAKPNAARVFNLWDITGDHTNATNTARGNRPCNLGLPVSTTNPCGYMLVINAAYKTDTAFQFNVSGACPSTYYEISAWFKNICYKCGCDSVGRTHSTAGYIPTAPGDTSGVRPNIAIKINGTDYYTTGDILYQGLGGTQTGSDTLNNWVQKAFVYKTGPSETNFTMTLRNNAPGGGGNDWALDDIALKTCTPTMGYSPSATPTVCQNNVIKIYDTVTCYYDTYNQYKWQRSTDGGASWSDVGSAGSATPTWTGSAWKYIVDYTIPTTATTASNDGDLYRLVVATTSSNLLSTTCNFTDPVTMTLDVLTDCGPVLKTDLISIAGKLNNDKAKVTWVTSKEEEPVSFELQRSSDGNNFTTIATLNGYYNIHAENNYYGYDDPTSVTGKVYYRVIMITTSGNKKYSRTIQLTPDKKDFGLGIVVNPFNTELEYEIINPQSGIAITELIDQYGITVRRQTQKIDSGVNALKISSTESLPSGIYTLKVSMNGSFVVRRVLKGAY